MQRSISAGASLEHLATFRDFVEAACREAGVADERVIFGLKLAVDEAVTNIVTHGYRDLPPTPIHLDFDSTPDQITLTLSDRGRAFDPADAPPPDLSPDWKHRRVGGLGLYFLQHMVDDVRYETDSQQINHLTLIKWIRHEGMENHGADL